MDVAEQEDMIGEARQAIEKLEQIVKKVTSPANRIGTFLGAPDRGDGADRRGRRGLLLQRRSARGSSRRCAAARACWSMKPTSSSAISASTRAGPVTKITEVLGPDRLRVGTEHGMQSLVLQRSDLLLKEKLKAGDEVRVDPNYRSPSRCSPGRIATNTTSTPCPSCRGRKSAASRRRSPAIRDAIELPLLHPDLFQRFQHSTPKGFLLYGPPGCGKTLIGKATAYNLTQQLKQQTGEEMREYFMHIKGPEILNMWVGESERMVREIFATAREKRREGYLPFLFIDEAESILGTRRASRFSNILSTLVPMFCTEMDGIDSLNEVVIILASNRADLIDPAILRPGRIDRKIKVTRPDREGRARDLPHLSLARHCPTIPRWCARPAACRPPSTQLVDRTRRSRTSAHRDENRFLSITLRSGKKDTLYRGDLISGAIIASIVERAKGLAIKRAIASRQEEGISEADLRALLRGGVRRRTTSSRRATSRRIGCSSSITTRRTS